MNGQGAGIPPETTVTVSETIDSTLIIRAWREGNGLLISMTSQGDYSGDTMDRRFYSVDELPPADLAPHTFWGTLLRQIGAFMGADDEG